MKKEKSRSSSIQIEEEEGKKTEGDDIREVHQIGEREREQTSKRERKADRRERETDPRKLT